MAAPTITSASAQKGNFGGGTTGTLTGKVSAGSDRILVISFNSKDNAGTPATVTSITFDSTGVNRTIGSGITQQGTTQEAIEGSFATMQGLYFILDADLPVSAGSYNIDIVLDSAVQYNMWTAYEITGCPKQAYDAILQSTDTADVAANTNWLTSLTPVDNDCLIVDNYALSHSNSGTYSNGQTLVIAETGNLYGGSICTEFTQVGSPASKSFTEQYTQLTHRRSWSIYSFSGLSSGTNITTNVHALTITENKATINAESNVLANTKALILTENQSNVSLGINISGNVHALIITTNQATINASKNVNTNLHALALTENQSNVNAENNINANVHNLTLTENNASISGNTNISANVHALLLTENKSNINAEKNINTIVDVLSITTYAATISSTSGNTNVITNVHALIISENVVNINAAKNIITNVHALNITTNIVDISTGQAPTSEGLEYTINGKLLHYTFDDEKIHYTMQG